MRSTRLPDSAFVVLALLAEREMHGYELQRVVHTRGFRFWTDLQRSSIYNALGLLQRGRLLTVQRQSGAGGERKVFRITRSGRVRLAAEGMARLASPTHPRSELDLGIYALPFMPRDGAAAAMIECIDGLRQRAEFLAERLSWCRERGLRIPALAFERPLLALEAEIAWLERVAEEQRHGVEISSAEWERYEYLEPPGAAPRSPRRRERAASKGGQP